MGRRFDRQPVIQIKPDAYLRFMALRISLKNYHHGTMATWTGLSASTAKQLAIEALACCDRPIETRPWIKVDTMKLRLQSYSEPKRNGGFSAVFIQRSSDRLIRISDHWSEAVSPGGEDWQLDTLTPSGFSIGPVSSNWWKIAGPRPVKVHLCSPRPIAAGLTRLRFMQKIRGGRLRSLIRKLVPHKNKPWIN